MDRLKLDRLFSEAARCCEQIPEADLDYALGFQRHARKTAGKRFPLDRILLKFGFLEEAHVQALYRAIRYYTWRKEDKFFLKIALQSKLMRQKQIDACLAEQKELYKSRNEVIRVNELARRRVYLTEKQELAIIEAMSKCRATTMSVTRITLDSAKASTALSPKRRARTDASGIAPKPGHSSRDPFADDDDEDDGLGAGSGFAPVESGADFDASESGFLDDSVESASGSFLEDSDVESSSFLEDSDDDFGLSGSEDAFSNGSSNFNPAHTEDDLDSLLPLHEGDAVDNLADRKNRKGRKPAAEAPRASKASAAPSSRAPTRPGKGDPFAASGEGLGKILSDDDLDALWEEADLDDLDLESDSRRSSGSPLLDSDDELDYSSSDDLF